MTFDSNFCCNFGGFVFLILGGHRDKFVSKLNIGKYNLYKAELIRCTYLESNMQSVTQE